MSTEDRREAERLRTQDPNVQAALQHSGSEAPGAAPSPLAGLDRGLLLLGGLLLAALLAAYVWLTVQPALVPGPGGVLVRRVLAPAAVIVVLLIGARLADVYICRQVERPASRHTLNRVLNLIVLAAVGLVVLTAVSDSWYTAAFSFGLVTVVIGFALRGPTASFIGWIYLVIRGTYRVGDRIKVGEAKGDVIDIGYFDTTLWEFGGPYLTTEHPSGRVISIPNSLVFTDAVFNYSWPLFPYVWNEVRLFVAYNSDLALVAETMQAVVAAELGETMLERVRVYRELLAQTAVDELQIQERPTVFFRAHDNTWIEAVVRYLVHPKQAGRVKSHLTRLLVDRLSQEPERVRFPWNTLR